MSSVSSSDGFESEDTIDLAVPLSLTQVAANTIVRAVLEAEVVTASFQPMGPFQTKVINVVAPVGAVMIKSFYLAPCVMNISTGESVCSIARPIMSANLYESITIFGIHSSRSGIMGHHIKVNASIDEISQFFRKYVTDGYEAFFLVGGTASSLEEENSLLFRICSVFRNRILGSWVIDRRQLRLTHETCFVSATLFPDGRLYGFGHTRRVDI